MSGAADLELVGDDAVRDPYACFGALRDADPVVWNERHRAWVLTRHEDVSNELRSQTLTAERIAPFVRSIERQAPSDEIVETFRILENWLVFRDPPKHTRLRRLVARAFTPSVVKANVDGVSATVDRLADDLAEHDTVDLIDRFAAPLPAIVIAQMLGVPPDDRLLFKAWSDQITALVFGAYGEADRFATGARGMIELRDYLVALIEHYEAHPGNNLMSVLLEHEGDDALSRDELVATCTLLLFGGHETTTNLIGNGMLALLTNPAERALLVDEPDRIGPAIEEMLRFDGPARATVRLVAERHTVGDAVLEPGERVFLINCAANRDPLVYDDPDRFDIERNPTNHLGFGVGIHYCLGAPLARLEGQLAIRAITTRFPGAALAAEPDSLAWHPTMLSRGLVELPVELRSR